MSLETLCIKMSETTEQNFIQIDVRFLWTQNTA